MKKIYFFSVFVFLTSILIAQTVGDYRSQATGNWGVASTWQRYTGSSWVTAVVQPSSSTNVTIMSEHTVTIEATGKSCKNLTINSSGELQTSVSTGAELYVYGNITCDGDLIRTSDEQGIYLSIEGPNCTISGYGNIDIKEIYKQFNTNATTNLIINRDLYLKVYSGNPYFFSNYAANSNFNITINAGKTVNVSQPPSNTARVRLDWGSNSGGSIIVNGTLDIYGTLIHYTDNTANGVSVIVNSGGVFKLSSLNWQTASGSAGSSIIVNDGGTFEIYNTTAYNSTNNTLTANSGSTVIYSYNASTPTQDIIPATYHNLKILNTSTKKLLGNITVNGTLTRYIGPLNLNSYSLTYGAGANLVYTGVNLTTTGEWLTASDNNILIDTNVVVTLTENKTCNGTINVNGSLYCVNSGTSYIISGTGNFNLNAGGTLKIGSVDGITSSGASGTIQVTGIRNYSSSANYYYNYNGSTNSYSGNGLPSSVNNFYIENHSAYTFYLTNNLTVNNYFYYKSGVFNKNGNIFSLGDNAILRYENSIGNVEAGDEWPDNTNADVGIYCYGNRQVVVNSKTLNGDLYIAANSKLLIWSDQVFIVNGNITNDGYLEGNNQGSVLQFCGSTFNANSTNNSVANLYFYGTGPQTISSLDNISYFYEIKIGSSSTTTFSDTQNLINPSENEKLTILNGGTLVIDGDISINVPIYAYGTINIPKNRNLYLNTSGWLYIYTSPITGSGTLKANSSDCRISVQDDQYLTSSSTNFDIISGTTSLNGAAKIGGQLKVFSGATLTLSANHLKQCENDIINEGTINGHVGCGFDFKGENFTNSGTVSIGVMRFTRNGVQIVSGFSNFASTISEFSIYNGANLTINTNETLTLATSSVFENKIGGTLTVNNNFTIYGLTGCSSIPNQRCGTFKDYGQITVNGVLYLCLGTVNMLGNPVNGTGKIQIGQEMSNMCDVTNLDAPNLASSSVTFEVPAGCAVGIGDKHFTTNGPSIIAGTFKMIAAALNWGSATFNSFITITGSFCGEEISCEDCNDSYKVYVNGGCSNLSNPISMTCQGTTQQSISGAFSNLTINNNAGVLLSNNTSAVNLTLTNGFMNSGENILTIGSSTSNLGTITRTSGHIIGKLRRWINNVTANDIIFPVGNNSHYRPTNISFTTAPTSGGTLLVEFVSSNPGTNGLPLNESGTIISNIGQDGYWKITTGDGLNGGVYNIDLTAEGFGGVEDYTGLRMLKRDTGGNWTFQGNHSVCTGSNSCPVLHRTDLNSFSEFGVGGASGNPLPVEIITFQANYHNGKVNLDWKTATEVDNYGFEIERASSLQNLNLNVYEKIGFVKGFGNSNSPKDYSFIDKNIKYGMVKYRLKQINQDGNFSYSNEVAIDIKLPDKFVLFQNYPNPFNPITTINYQLPKKSFISVKIYDVIGRVVETIVNEEQTAGNYEIKFDGSNLVSGIYFYKLISVDSDGKQITLLKKMVLLK